MHARLISETQIDTIVPRCAEWRGRHITGDLSTISGLLESLGYYRLEATEQPTPRDGYHMEARYAYDDAERPTAVCQSWVEVKDPPAPSRSLSRKKLRDAFVGLGGWDAVRDYLQSSDMWEIFLLSTTLDEDNELVQEAIVTLRESFGLSDEKIEEIIAASVVD